MKDKRKLPSLSERAREQVRRYRKIRRQGEYLKYRFDQSKKWYLTALIKTAHLTPREAVSPSSYVFRAFFIFATFLVRKNWEMSSNGRWRIVTL